MSLIGSLEDLGLGDILQIISLSQKSGVLTIRSDQGEGRIAVRAGLVRGALVKGGAEDLRTVLVDGGFVSGERYDAALSDALERQISPEQVLAEAVEISEERIDSLRREAVESAVVSMFQWQSGDFSFDIRNEPEPGDPQLFLTTGVNAQYLAMEGLRVRDESDRDDPSDSGERIDRNEQAGGKSRDLDAEEVDEQAQRNVAAPSDIESADAVEVVAEATLARVASDSGEPLESELLEAVPIEDESAAPSIPAGRALESSATSSASLIVIDSDLAALEWTKRHLADRFERVHIFQSADHGLTRIRQYLARAQVPVVLVAPDAPGDPFSGIRDATDFVERLSRQAPEMCLAWLCASGGSRPVCKIAGMEEVMRPNSEDLRSPLAAAQVQETARRLARDVAEIVRVRREHCVPNAEPRGDKETARLARLKQVTAHLNEASTRGEVLPVLLEFASELFSRAAVFLVRDQRIVGIAQVGMERAGGPGDEDLQSIELSMDECAWLAQAIEGRAPLRHRADARPPELALRLATEVPGAAYLAPIESSEQVVALLYADNLPLREPTIADTSDLEVVLRHAGLALDRAALERALAESEAR